MQLVAARVTNYRLIQDTGQFRVDDLTCLVGKNESGKTAVLKALHRLKPDDEDEADFDIEVEYPRQHLFDYKPRHADNPDPIIEATWELDDDEAAWIADRFGPSALTARTVTTTKRYDNRFRWSLHFDEVAAVMHLVTTSRLDQVDIEALAGIKSADELAKKVADLPQSERRDAFSGRLTGIVGSSSARQRVIAACRDWMPTFVYYANYYALPGQMSLEQFVSHEASKQLTRPQKVFRALLGLVGSTAQALSATQTYETLKADLEAIGLRLSKEIFDYWSQNRDLEVEFAFDAARPGDPPPFDSGYVFRTRIKNRRHGVSVSFDERSTGFVWFFSFLVWFSQMQREHGKNLILLLDEPGLSLHGTAQADLLRYINDKLVPRYQVVYTTHSPFMVDANNLAAVRTVEDVTVDEEVRGTKVGDQVLSSDAETLFPLRAALGYDITQTMFIGEHCLLVEGPSDLLYLRWASERLRQRGRIALDRRWTITPCGGIRKIGSFLSLFGAHHLHVAVLTDYAHGNKAAVRSLRESRLLRSGHVLTADMFVEADEADLEDLLGRSLYFDLVNKTYGLTGKHALKKTSKDKTPRVTVEVEEQFRLLSADKPDFDHLPPAVFLFEHSQEFTTPTDVEPALERFEQVFIELNGLLG